MRSLFGKPAAWSFSSGDVKSKPTFPVLTAVARKSALTWIPGGTVNVGVSAVVLIATLLTSGTEVFHKNSSPFCTKARMCAEPSVLNAPIRRTAQTVRVSGTGSTGVWGCFNWNQALWGP